MNLEPIRAALAQLRHLRTTDLRAVEQTLPGEPSRYWLEGGAHAYGQAIARLETALASVEAQPPEHYIAEDVEDCPSCEAQGSLCRGCEQRLEAIADYHETAQQ